MIDADDDEPNPVIFDWVLISRSHVAHADRGTGLEAPVALVA
jgi:hypothetical protein